MWTSGTFLVSLFQLMSWQKKAMWGMRQLCDVWRQKHRIETKVRNVSSPSLWSSVTSRCEAIHLCLVHPGVVQEVSWAACFQKMEEGVRRWGRSGEEKGWIWAFNMNVQRIPDETSRELTAGRVQWVCGQQRHRGSPVTWGSTGKTGCYTLFCKFEEFLETGSLFIEYIF